MHRACRIIVLLFAAAYLAALALLAIGTFGLFGSERDPLAGVFLLPLGLPWNLMFDDVAERARPWLAAAAPALNVAILWFICRAASSRRR